MHLRMKLHKAIFLSILYYAFLVLVELWILLIPREMASLELLKTSHLINSVATLIFLLFIFKLIKQTDLLKLKKADSKYYLIALILGIGFVFFQSILNVIYHQETSSEFFDYDFTLERLISMNAIASIMVVPVTEELFFRKYILGSLIENYKPLIAIIISSLLFAFIHIPFASIFFENFDFSLHQAYIALFGGIISGVLFYKSKSIIPSIIFHVFWNLTSFIF